jgi:antitoxin component YwqK of YwqJK toxin-antitoxin module
MKQFLAFCFCLFSLIGATQKVLKEYYPNYHIKLEYQVNSDGLKNGFFKSYSTVGELYESGFFTNGEKSGTWTTYGIMQGHSGEIAATMEYSNGKMNGRYVQYCWSGGKRYICGDYEYVDDEEVAAMRYYVNGKLSERFDVRKGFHEKWFEDGTPLLEMKGKYLYEYEEDEWGNRSVSNIYFDSTDFHIQLHFSGKKGRLRIADFCEKDASKKLNGYHKILKSIRYNGGDNIEILEGSSKLALDSTLYRFCFELYCNAPSPNINNTKCSYDFTKGDIIDIDYNRFIKHPDPKGGFTFEEYYESGVLVRRVLKTGVVQYFVQGKLESEVGPDEEWVKIYYPSGFVKEKISKESKGDYKIKYNEQGDVVGEFGYINGKKRAFVNRCYYDSGRLKWDVRLNQNDSIDWPNYVYKFADNDSAKVIAIVDLVRISDDFINKETTNKKDVESILMYDYRARVSAIVKKINEGLYKDGVYLKTELVYDKINRIVSSDNYSVQNATDFTLVDLSFKRLNAICNNIKTIKIPSTSEEEKILKKAKEPNEVLRLLEIKQ